MVSFLACLVVTWDLNLCRPPFCVLGSHGCPIRPRLGLPEALMFPIPGSQNLTG